MKRLTDPKDIQIMNKRIEAYKGRKNLSVGDVIKYSDGKTMRVAYIHSDRVQPCWGGSFYMYSNGNCEMSGSLDTSIPIESLTRTNETANVDAWFFHHDHAGAGMGRDFTYPARVWKVNQPAPRKHSETFYLCQVDDEYAKNRTCGNYHYLVTKGSTSWTAFEKEADFLRWMENNDLKLSEPLAPCGQHKSQMLS